MTDSFKFRQGTRLPKTMDAQAVGEKLRDLHDENDGLTATLVVASAEAEDSPLHSAFTWDDTVAGRKLRENEARILMRSVVTITVTVEAGETVEKELNVLVHVPAKSSGEGKVGVYTTLPKILESPEMFVRALDGAMRYAVGAERAVNSLLELARDSSKPKIESACSHLRRAYSDLDSLRSH